MMCSRLIYPGPYRPGFDFHRRWSRGLRQCAPAGFPL